MAFGFPAHSSESRTYARQPHELVLVAKSTFDDLDWRYEALPNCSFLVKIPTNAFSWGEVLSVEIYPNGLVKADSKCVYPLQLFDWGKNQRNVRVFFSKFELMIKIELQG